MWMEGSSPMSNGREGTEIDLSKITLRPLDLADIDDFMVWAQMRKSQFSALGNPMLPKKKP